MAEALIVKASDLLGRREDAHVEFTLKVDESGRFLESVVAFLNTDGGSLYFGVEDANAQAVAVPGVDDPEKDSRRIIDMIADRIEPRPSLAVPERLPTEGGRTVLRLRVEGRRSPRHALRDGKSHVFCERVGDRNRAMSWSEVQRALADEPRSDEPRGDEAIPTAFKLMTGERSKFLANKERTTLRVACWPVPLDVDRVDLQRDGKEISQALWDGSVVGVRSSGWNFLSSAQPRMLPAGIEGGQAGPPTYRHVRIAGDGRVEFETDRDELWSWHAQAMGDAVIDPFVLLEYPVSVLHLARWLLTRNETIAPPLRILVDLSIRNVRGVQLGAGSPASVTYGMRGWGRLREDVDALCIRETGPVEVSGDEFMANPDRVAFRLASESYRAFGWEAKDIPFYDAATERFVFPR